MKQKMFDETFLDFKTQLFNETFTDFIIIIIYD